MLPNGPTWPNQASPSEPIHGPASRNCIVISRIKFERICELLRTQELSGEDAERELRRAAELSSACNIPDTCRDQMSREPTEDRSGAINRDGPIDPLCELDQSRAALEQTLPDYRSMLVCVVGVMLQHQCPEVRLCALILHRELPPDPERPWGRLIDALEDAEARVRLAAIQVLRTLPESSFNDVLDRLLGLLEHKDVGSRGGVIYVLQQLPCTRIIPHISRFVQILACSPEQGVRQAVARLLLKAPASDLLEHLPQLTALTSDSFSYARAQGVRLLGKLALERPGLALNIVWMLTDSSEMVRDVAIETLEELVIKLPPAQLEDVIPVSQLRQKITEASRKIMYF